MKPQVLKYLPKLTKRDKTKDKFIVYVAEADGRKFSAKTKLQLFDDIKKVYSNTTFNSLVCMKITYESLIS